MSAPVFLIVLYREAISGSKAADLGITAPGKYLSLLNVASDPLNVEYRCTPPCAALIRCDGNKYDPCEPCVRRAGNLENNRDTMEVELPVMECDEAAFRQLAPTTPFSILIRRPRGPFWNCKHYPRTRLCMVFVHFANDADTLALVCMPIGPQMGEQALQNLRPYIMRHVVARAMLFGPTSLVYEKPRTAAANYTMRHGPDCETGAAIVAACPNLLPWQKATVSLMADDEVAGIPMHGFLKGPTSPRWRWGICAIPAFGRFLVARPGMGKTRLVAGLMLATPKIVTIVVPPQALVSQWARALAEFDTSLAARLVDAGSMGPKAIAAWIAAHPAAVPEGAIILIPGTRNLAPYEKTEGLFKHVDKLAPTRRLVLDEFHLILPRVDFPYDRERALNQTWFISGTSNYENIERHLRPPGVSAPFVRFCMARHTLAENPQQVMGELETAGLCVPDTHQVVVRVQPTPQEAIAYAAAAAITEAATGVVPSNYICGINRDDVVSVRGLWNRTFKVVPREGTIFAAASGDMTHETLRDMHGAIQWHGSPVDQEARDVIAQISSVARENATAVRREFVCHQDARQLAARWLLDIARNVYDYRVLQKQSALDLLASRVANPGTERVLALPVLMPPMEGIRALESGANQGNAFLQRLLATMREVAATRQVASDAPEARTENDCPVCYDTIGHADMRLFTSCGHAVCKDCAPDSRECPLCRKKVAGMVAVDAIVDNIAAYDAGQTTPATPTAAGPALPAEIPFSKIVALLEHLGAAAANGENSLVYVANMSMAQYIGRLLEERPVPGATAVSLFRRHGGARFEQYRAMTCPTILVTNIAEGLDLPNVRNIFIPQTSDAWIGRHRYIVDTETQLISRCRRIGTNREPTRVVRFIMADTIEEVLASAYWGFDTLQTK